MMRRSPTLSAMTNDPTEQKLLDLLGEHENRDNGKARKLRG